MFTKKYISKSCQQQRPCCDLETAFKVGLTIAAASLGGGVRARSVPGHHEDHGDDDGDDIGDDGDDDVDGDDNHNDDHYCDRLLGHDSSPTSNKVLPCMWHHAPRLESRPRNRFWSCLVSLAFFF